jgi:DNA helicase-2/ATP-dependent DNA helicase PcrA
MTATQREAVLADDPVVCVVASAGAGKTGVLTARVARRAADETARAERTTVCTFSRKAAEELALRLHRLGVHRSTVGTIHRLALRILADRAVRDSRPPPIVLGKRNSLLESLVAARSRLAVSADQLESEIGWAKAQMLGPVDYPAAVRRAHRQVRIPVEVTAELFSAYEQERRRRCWLDLDDLLVESATAIEADRGLAEAVRWRHRHVFVDEMQDVNAAQFRLLQAVVGPDPDLFVVGDPSQCVYGWNGADPGLIDAMTDLFERVRVIRLDDNHRSTRAIVTLAEAALGHEQRRVGCSRPDGTLPVVSVHEDDEDEARWVTHQAWLAHRPGRRWSHTAVLARTNAQLEVVGRVLTDRRIPVTMAGGDLAPASDLGPLGADATVEPTADELSQPEGQEADGVVLSTFHRAKGLQWPCVFVVGLSEGLVPIGSARSPGALAEERRLLYVAMTRAEDLLWCSWSRSGSTDAHRGRRPTRWLADVERSRFALEREQTPAPPEVAASHLARIRALVTRNPSP